MIPPPFTVVYNFCRVTYALFVICLYSGWLVSCCVKCLKTLRMYRVCKITPNHHPTHSDIQYLSQQRKLYNLETYGVKYFLMFLCILLELGGIVWMMLTSTYINVFINNDKEPPNCTAHSDLVRFYFYPFSLIMYNTSVLLYMSLFTLLSILTRYLSARYLNHSFKKTLTKYLTWLSVQVLIITVCSSIYTVIALYLIIPLISVINWLLLFRDIRILSQVLRSNLRELELFSNNRILYLQNVYGFRLFRIFQKCLLFSLSFIVVTFIVYSCNAILKLICHSFCVLNELYGTHINTSIDIHGIGSYVNILINCIFFLHSISSSFPLLTITVLPLLRECVKRYRSRNFVYRYNYGNIQSAQRLI